METLNETSADENIVEDENTEPLNESDAEMSDAEEQVDEPTESEENATESELEIVQKQYADMKDKYVRLNAEFENFKKRMIKENQDRLKYHSMEFAKSLLPAIDSLEKAMEHAQGEEANGKAILEGVEMVHKMIQESFEKFHITRIEPVGEAFDPNQHQAVGMVEADDVPENHVADVFQVGYFLHDRIMRPAMVRVSQKNS